MIVTKITHGFVAQRFDASKNAWLGQEFIAGDQVEYEDARGDPLAADSLPESLQHAYLRFEMKQPAEMADDRPRQPMRKRR